MKSFRSCIIILYCFSAMFFICSINAQGQSYLGQTPPGNTPIRLVPDNLAANSQYQFHGTPAFSPDGTEMYYSIYRFNPGRVELWFTEYVNGSWTVPQKAPFANNDYDNNCPMFSKDKNVLYFFSTRPGGFIFKVTRTNGVWSAPVALNLPIPSGYSVGLQFSIADNGNVYAELSKDGNDDLYLWRYNNGQYQTPEKLTDLCSPQLDFTPFIDPSEQFIMFASRRPGGFGSTDIYFSKRNADNTWAIPVNIGKTINSGEVISPIISRDGKYFLFEAWMPGAPGGNPYWVDAKFIFDMVTDVEDEENKEMPQNFILNQNFPNPFNPTTTISYSIKTNKPVNIIIKVFDLLGKEIATLVNKEQRSGQYQANFDASNLTSGVYFYELDVEGVRKEVRKMNLIK